MSFINKILIFVPFCLAHFSYGQVTKKTEVPVYPNAKIDSSFCFHEYLSANKIYKIQQIKLFTDYLNKNLYLPKYTDNSQQFESRCGIRSEGVYILYSSEKINTNGATTIFDLL
jgi:hypothetical protein